MDKCDYPPCVDPGPACLSGLPVGRSYYDDVPPSATIDGKSIKIASTIDEHPRRSLLNVVERSITVDRVGRRFLSCHAEKLRI